MLAGFIGALAALLVGFCIYVLCSRQQQQQPRKNTDIEMAEVHQDPQPELQQEYQVGHSEQQAEAPPA